MAVVMVAAQAIVRSAVRPLLPLRAYVHAVVASCVLRWLMAHAPLHPLARR